MTLPVHATRDLAIVGAGGLAREMRSLIRSIDPSSSRWRMIGFVDSTMPAGTSVGGDEVVGDDTTFMREHPECAVVLGVGTGPLRHRLLAWYATAGYDLPELRHPTALIDGDRIEVGRGNIFTAHVIVTCDVTIGDGNLFNLSATIGHDVVVGSGCVINPAANLSGGVRLGDGVLVGTGAQLLEGVRVEDFARIGAGAVVNRDVSAGQTVVGVPARPLEPSHHDARP